VAAERLHDWRGQQISDEWDRTCVPVFVCASCGSVFQVGGKSRWLEVCEGKTDTHAERYRERSA